MSMIRLREDVDGCGCIRCQDIRHDVLQQSLSDAVLWSSRLPVVRPSIVVLFLIVGLVQFLLTGADLMLLSVVVGLLGVLFGRGFIGIVGLAALSDRQYSVVEAVHVVGRRFPSLVGALLTISVCLAVLVVVLTNLVSPLVQTVVRTIGVTPVVAEVVMLVFLAGGIVYVLVKFCFVPEACIVGGYGPIRSLRVSWTVTTVHRRKVLAIVAGFVVLLWLGILLDTHLSDPESPVVVSFRYQETTVVLRSFGFSVGSGLRLAFDLFVTTIYSGVFFHQYVAGSFESERELI